MRTAVAWPAHRGMSIDVRWGPYLESYKGAHRIYGRFFVDNISLAEIGEKVSIPVKGELIRALRIPTIMWSDEES